MKPRIKTVAISPDALEVLKRSTFTGSSVVLPEGQLDRAVYDAVNKALTAAGGKWNRSAKAHVFPAGTDPRAIFPDALASGRVVNEKATLQAFYTPPSVARRVIELAGIEPGMSVLEPSAGEGALAVPAREAGGVVTCVEMDPKACAKLRALHLATFEEDFLAIDWTSPEINGRFDRVVMNPPFTAGQEVEHVRAALALVRPGGRLVAVMSRAIRFRTDRPYVELRHALVELDARLEDLPSGSFETSGTGVETLILTVNAGESA